MMGKLNKKLWGVCREYGVDSETLHQIAKNELKLDHISECSTQEFLYLIDRVCGKKAVPPSPRGMVSPAQKALILHLAEVLGWDDQARLAGFIRKYAKVHSVDWLTKRQASAVIEGLKKLEKKK